MRYSVRSLLIFVTIIALAAVAYRCFTSDIVRSKAALQLFGPNYEWDGVLYDRQVAHDRLVGQLESNGVLAIPEPSWISEYPVLGVGSDSGWTPTRSDWFFIQQNGVEACVNLASSDSGFAVVIWVHRELMWHELDDQPNAIKREVQLMEQVNDEWQRKIWPRYVSEHHD